MAYLADPTLNPAGIINASPVIPPSPTPPVTPDMSGALTGQPHTAEIPDTTPTSVKPVVKPAPVAPTVAAPVTTPTTPAKPTTDVSTPIYGMASNPSLITGYTITHPDGTTSFSSTPVQTTTPAPITRTPPVGMTAQDYADFKKANPNIEPTSQDVTRAQLAQAQQDYQTQSAKVQTLIENISAGVIPLNPAEQAQIDGLKQQYKQLIDAQNLTNIGATGLANVRGYQTGAAEYDPTFQVKTIGAIVTAGQNKVADLMAKEATAVAQLTDAFKKEDIAAIKDAWSMYQDASAKRTEALQKTIDDTQKAIKDANDAQIAAEKVQYDQVTKPIQDMAAEAGKYGAPQSVIDAINASKDVASAMTAGAGYLQDPTSPAGQYNAYVKATQAKGLTPMTPADFLLKQEKDKAYGTAYSAAAGKAAANQALGLNADGTPIAPADTTSPTGVTGSILSATGLSVPAFNFLTTGTSALTRMSQQERLKYMNEAQAFLNKNGVDISTFQSQYKALGQTVQANSLRNNQASVAEAELDATLDNLKQAADDSSFGNIRWGNVAKLFAGQEVNDANVSKYAFHLNQLREEFAMYNAALAGQIDANGNIREINASDRAVADNIIKTGFAAGSIKGFEDALAASRSKMRNVLDSSINAQNKKVWQLFGVGSQYKPPATPVDAKADVDSYIRTNPSQAETVAKLYELPGWDDQAVLDYINKLKPQ